jgi:uncharacterized protein (TIGR00255 family)
MICSMTAFARELYRGDEGELVWEIRSVNHRYLEAFVRLPEDLRGLEGKVRERLGKRLKRGKVDCGLRYKPGTARNTDLAVNRSLIKSLSAAADEIGRLTGHSSRPDPMELMRWPGVMEEQPLDLTPVQEKAMELLERTLDELLATRHREGARLADILRERCAGMLEHTRQVRDRMPEVLIEIRERLYNRLQEVLEQMDEQRVEQEMVLLAQRLDVDEEMDRLATHLDEVVRVLDQGGAVGRRLEFLMQELNRETNTLTSKSSDVEITRHSVDMKVLIEQMREQIQNLE